MDFFDNINIDALQPLQDIFPDGWFDDVRQMYGENLSDEIISQSVEETCDFFHIEEPAILSEGWTTGVYANNDFTLQDDVLIFNREQLLDMGISGKDGLDLVMTHEGTHRVLQGMEHLEFDSHQEELCCDYMAGVRAGLNDINISQMESALMYTPETETHPTGIERVEAIEAGIRFAQQYYAEYNIEPTFYECIENFCGIEHIDNNAEINKNTINEYNVSFEGSKSDKEWYDYYKRKEKDALDWQNWHLKQADYWAGKHDETSYKDHIDRAKIWGGDVKKYGKLAQDYKNKL